MLIRNSESRYGGAVIALHWAMLALIALAYASIELRELWPKGTPVREALKSLHFTLGLTVLLLVGVRIVLRVASGPAPAIQPPIPSWQEKLSGLLHLVLYAFMIAMPIAGWIVLSAEGKAIPFFGFALPALVGESKGFAKSVKELHEAAGTIGYFLIGVHALAGLVHHYVRHDNTLRRMLAGRA